MISVQNICLISEKVLEARLYFQEMDLWDFFQSILQITKLRTNLFMTSLGSGVGVQRQSQVRTSYISVSSLKLDPVVGVLLFLPFFLSLHPFILSFPSFLFLFLFFSELLGLHSHSLAHRTWPILLSDLFLVVDYFLPWIEDILGL